jgi:hypothetical protein
VARRVQLGVARRAKAMDKKSAKAAKDLAVKGGNAVKGGLSMRKSGAEPTPSIIAIL